MISPPSAAAIPVSTYTDEHRAAHVDPGAAHRLGVGADAGDVTPVNGWRAA